MSKKARLKLAWFGLAVLITVPLVVTYNPISNRDNDIVLIYALLAFTFPIGIAVAALIALVGYLLEVSFSAQLPAGRLEMILDCVVFLAAGYLQWFVALPAIWKMLKREGSMH